MPEIEIYGKTITVGDEFKKLSAEQQQSMVNQIANELGLGPSKAERFLRNVTPEGPISGLISLMRLSGQAAQGRAPGLLTEEGVASAIPAAVQGSLFGPGAAAGLSVPIEAAARLGTRTYRPPGRPWEYQSPMAPEPPPQAPRQLTYQPAKPTLEEARAAAKRMHAGTEVTPYEPYPATPIEVRPTGPEQVPPASPLLPRQTVSEFGAVRRGVELSTRLREAAEAEGPAREAALNKAIQPHLREIFKIGSRSPEAAAVVDKAFEQSTLSSAIKDPAKAASLAAWMGVYERAARAKFTPQAQASLALATRNLNNNLGTDLTLKDILGAP